MRKNHPDHLSHYDTAYIELPECSNTARIIVVPMKTIYINIAAAPWENVDRLFYHVEDAEEFMEMMGML